MEVKQGKSYHPLKCEDEACKTRITKVLKQSTLVEDDAFTQSGYNSMQASDG